MSPYGGRIFQKINRSASGKEALARSRKNKQKRVFYLRIYGTRIIPIRTDPGIGSNQSIPTLIFTTDGSFGNHQNRFGKSPDRSFNITYILSFGAQCSLITNNFLKYMYRIEIKSNPYAFSSPQIQANLKF